MKTAAASRLRNRAYSSRMRTAVKELRAMTSKDEASRKYCEVASILDGAAARHIIHKKTADRGKSRLALFVQKLG
jgi:small subunit ribosomal protein S20